MLKNYDNNSYRGIKKKNINYDFYIFNEKENQNSKNKVYSLILSLRREGLEQCEAYTIPYLSHQF